MKVIQTSPTTWELLTDNGCIALAGYARATMGRPGVYFVRPGHDLTRESAERIFAADTSVQAAIAAEREVKP